MLKSSDHYERNYLLQWVYSLQIIPEQKPPMKMKNNSLIPSARHLIDAMKDVPLIYIRVIILKCAFHFVFSFNSFFSFHFFYLIFQLICLWHRDDGLTGAQIIRNKKNTREYCLTRAKRAIDEHIFWPLPNILFEVQIIWSTASIQRTNYNFNNFLNRTQIIRLEKKVMLPFCNPCIIHSEMSIPNVWPFIDQWELYTLISNPINVFVKYYLCFDYIFMSFLLIVWL